MAQAPAIEDHTPLTEDLFRQIYKYQPKESEPIASRIIKRASCTGATVSKYFPIVKWLPTYNWKSDILGDMVAGLTITVMHIPHGLAYAPLAGQSPVVGLYMAVFSTLVYFFLGTSRHLSLGTFAVLCMMVGKTVSEHSTEFQLSNNETMSNQTSSYSNMEVGITICFLVGVWEFVMGSLRLGALWLLLSNSLVSGFTTGAATHVVIYQFKNFLDIKTKSFTGPLKLIYIIIDLVETVPHSNTVTIGLSCCAIFLLCLFNEYLKPIIQKRYRNCRVPIPIELIVIILGITASYTLDLEKNYGVRIVKSVPRGLPEPVVPVVELIPKIAVDCFVMAVVGISMSLSLASIFAKKGGYEIDANQELIAYGAGNIFAAFFQCAPASASLSRSLVQHSSGGKSQIASIFTMSTIILILLFLGPLFEPVPYSVLSSIVVVSLKGLVWQVKDFPTIWRLSKLDGAVWLVTFFSVILIDLDYGLGIGLCMSVLTLILRGQYPKVIELGRLPNTNLYLDKDSYKDVETMDNIIVLKVIGSLHFANYSTVHDSILKYQKRFNPSNVFQTEKTKLAIILDISCVPNIDPTSANGLNTLYKDLRDEGIQVFLTHCNSRVYDFLLHCKFFDSFPTSNVLFTTFDAIEFLSDV